MKYKMIWQLSNPEARRDRDLTAYGQELDDQYNEFNRNCRSGQLVDKYVKTDTVELTYECDADLVKPGAALHSFSQGLVENYQVFAGMLSSDKPQRLFQSK